MDALRIEILNPKALQLLNGMQDLNLIKLTKEPETKLMAYLRKTRKNSASAPTVEEIAELVQEVRASRYGKK